MDDRGEGVVLALAGIIVGWIVGVGWLVGQWMASSSPLGLFQSVGPLR